MLHPNSPFLTKESVEDCLANVLSGKHSSAFTACKHNSFAWFNGSPLNYSIGKPTPHLRDLVPVVLEQSSLFVFTRENFHEYTSRVSPEPFIRYIDYFEAHGINSAHELDIAEILVNSGLVKKSIPGSRNRKVLVD
jgi:CMP-N-acetylneuraminic acid synthetase